MENKQTSPRGSRVGGLGHVAPSRTGFTTQRLSLIVENRRRKTWEKPELLEIKTSARAGDSGTKGFVRRQNSAPNALRRQSSLEDSRADDNMSVVSDSSSDSVFLNRASTPVKTRHYSDGAQYYSSPNLSPVSTGSQSVRMDRERNIRQLQGLNGTAQSHFTRKERINQNVQSTDDTQNCGDDGGKRLSESDAISTMGRRAYYRAKKAERSPTSRKFEQLLKGDISSSLEQLSHITGEAAPDFGSSDVRKSRTSLNLGNDDSFLISRSLDSHLNTIHSEGTRFKSPANADNKTISHSVTAKCPVTQREMSKETSKADMPLDNREYSHIINSEHKLSGTYDVAQDSENIEGQGLTTVDSDTRDYNRRDVNLKLKMEEPKVENYRGQNCHQLSTTTGLEHNNLFVYTNMAPEMGTYGGNVPANVEIIHNDTTCPNQSYGTKQSLRSDSTLQNNADQSGAEKCSFMQPERNNQNDKNAFTNNSKVAKDKSAVYVYDGSLMSPARHKSPAKLFAKKGPSVFGGFSRLFSRKGKEKHAEPDGNTNCHRSVEETVQETDIVCKHNKLSPEVEDDDSLDNNCLLSDNKDDSIEINTSENVSAEQERSLEQVNEVEADVIVTTSKDDEYHDNKIEEGKESTEEDIVNKNYGSNDSLDSLDNDLFSHQPTEKVEESTEKKPKEIKMKDKEIASVMKVTVKRSQSVRELTQSERNNLEKTGSITGFPLSKAFFQAPVGRSSSLLPSWRRWSSQNNFEAVREESESQSEEEDEPQNAAAVTSSNLNHKDSGANDGASAKGVHGFDKCDKNNTNSNGDDASTDGDSDSDLSSKFVDYFKRNGKVAIHTDGSKTVVVNSRGSFKNISYNPEFTKEGLQVGTEMSRTECSQLDLPEEDRPEENEEEEIKAKLKQYRVILPDATVTESSDVQYHDSLENLDENQNVDKSGQNKRECDQDSVLRDGSLSDHSHKSNETSDHRNTKLTEIRDRRQKGSGDRVRSHSDLGLKGYMYNPKHDPTRQSTFKWHSTQSTTDLRHTGETESESSSSAADTMSSQGYDSEQHNASMDDIRKQLSSMTSHFSAHITK